MKVCIDMSIAQPPASVPYAEFIAEQHARAHAERERDQERARRIQVEKLLTEGQNTYADQLGAGSGILSECTGDSTSIPAPTGGANQPASNGTDPTIKYGPGIATKEQQTDQGESALQGSLSGTGGRQRAIHGAVQGPPDQDGATGGADNATRTDHPATAAPLTRPERKLARDRRIISRLLAYRHTARTHEQQIARFERRYGCKLETLIDEKTPPKMVPLAAFQKLQQRFNFLRKGPYKPTERLVIDEVQYQLENPQKVDADGFARINYQTAAKRINMSSSTPPRSIRAVIEQTPDYPLECKWNVPEVTQDGKKIEVLFAKATVPNLVTASMNATLEQKRKQGGNQYECQRCHSDMMMIERRLICLDCGHTTMLEPTYPNGRRQHNKGKSVKSNLLLNDMPVNTANTTGSEQATPDENFLTDDAQPVGMVITSYPPLVAGRLQTAAEMEEEASVIMSAAELLLKVAGQDEKHITMPRTHEKKYLEVKRPLDRSDLVEHLRAGEAKGALCAYEDGSTYALIFDTDDSEEWAVWKLAALKLAQARYIVLMDESPAGRGGHLVIIFDALVLAAAARAAVLQIAPELATCREYWPGGTANRVRLPGAYYARNGKYVEQPVEAWCQLFNASTGEMASDGVSAARLLLSSLTPAQIVPALPVISSEPAPEIETQDDQQPPACIVVEQEPEAPTIASAGAGELPMPKVDAKWVARYGKLEETTYWFAITPEVAARWYNERNPLESIRPTETNGMALSVNGNERTASTGYYEKAQGERWTDFSTHGLRSDGKHDSGDALELAAKVEGKSKSAFLNGVILDMIKEGKPALESAAVAGQPLPGWFEEPDCIITPAGRLRAAALAGQPIPAWLEEIISPALRRLYEKWLNAQAQGQTVAPAAVTIEQPAPEIVTQDNQQPEQEAAAPAAVTQPEHDQAAAAREFYAAHCSTPGYSLRIRPDGQIGIGVPEDLSDPEFERIAEQVGMYGEVLRQIIQECDPQRPGQGEQAEQKPALVQDQRVTTPAGMGTVSLVSYCDVLQRWRCSVFTQAEQPNGSHFAVFDASEVQPIEQRPLL
jgi:hypothetical protein